MSDETPIAVVGLAYRAPGIGRKGLWDYLSQARSAWTKVPADRFDQSAFYKPGSDKSGVFRAQGAHFISEDIYAFDAAFFNMRADEARNSDPQHRMLLECALEAAEDAGHSLLDLAGKNIGVFIGINGSDYSSRMGDDEHFVKTWSATGLATCMAANRISYFFDIDGPSTTLDAACASSVYAAHQAVASLRKGECDGAFVGAASLYLGPNGWLMLEKTGALSEHGRIYSYDSKAAGFGRGEGAACLLIKRMDDAIRDGDPIQAVIRGSAVNHGGRTDGITMPNGIAHRKLLLAAHKAAGLNPSETAVVEGHGTGTPAGDPIEAGAFTAVLAKERTASNPIYVGSIKSNFGHLEGASGMLGIVKAILMIKHGIILPTAGFESINPKIQDKEKIRVLDTPIPWPEGERKRVIVTNFGFGGSNSAIILEENPYKYAENGTNGTNGTNGINGANGVHDSNGLGALNGVNGSNGVNGDTIIHKANGTHSKEKESDGPLRRLFVLSARTEKSLSSYLSSFDEYLDEAPEPSDFVKNLSYTLGQRRTHHIHRVFAVANSVESLQDKLSNAQLTRSREQTIAFVFTGQGAQHAEMASGLRHYKIFANALDEAEAQIGEMGASWSLAKELAQPASASRVDDAEISQPACTAVQLALVLLLQSWGIVPATVMGHSSGEIAAAFSAGLVSFRSAIAIAYYRGQVAAQLARRESHKGAMLALGVNSEEATELVEKHAGGYATVAAINSPQSVTISGDQQAIENVHKAADAQGIFARRLKVQMAYHSRHMDEGAAYYLDAIKPYCAGDAFSLKNTDVSRPVFVSSVTGHAAHPDEIDESYWVKNLVRPVRFLDAIQSAFTPREKGTVSADRGIPNLVVEIGPHSALKNPIKQTLELVQLQRPGNQQASAFTYVPSLVRGTDGEEAMLNLAGSLFALGAPVELAAVNQTDMRNAEVVVGLPPYEFDKSVSYEILPRHTEEKLFPGDSYNPLLGRRARSNGGNERAYRQVFTLDEVPWIREHNVSGVVVFPMTGYLSCAIEAARRTLSAPAAAFLLTDFHAVRRLEIQEEETVDMMTKIRPAVIGSGTTSSTAWTFEISTWTKAEGWRIHAHGKVEPESAEMTMDTPTLKAAHTLVDTTSNITELDTAVIYEFLGARGTRYGPTFKNSVRFFDGDGYTVLENKLRDIGELTGPFGSPVTVDPPTLDGFLQGGGPLQKTEDGRRRAQMPNYISRFRISNKIPAEPGQRFDIVTRLLSYDVKGGRMHLSIAVFGRGHDNSLTPVAEWESILLRTIGAVEDDLDPASNLPDNWAWDLLSRFDLLPTNELAKRITVWDSVETEMARAAKMTKAACYYMDRGMKETANDDRSKLPFHLARFVNWATKHLPEYGMQFDSEPTELLDEVRSDAQGQLLCFVGERLTQILRQEVEPLEIMLADGRLTRSYESDPVSAHSSKVMGELISNLAELNPDLRILEIGGGTAGTTKPVLEELTREEEYLTFSNYTFTDISSGFFENARVKLAKWSQRITYQKLDITIDPEEQGFTPESFDIIIAANVLHATKNMTVTMANVRKLLTPGGKLFLLEGNRHPPFLLPFFLLPGWWYSEDEYRDKEEGPLMTLSTWNRLLLDSGFSGIDINIFDRPGSDIVDLAGVMCSTRVGKQEPSQPITVCGPFMDDDEVEFAQLVADSVSEQLGCLIEIRPFAEIDPTEEPYYIFIDSPRNSVMQNVSSEKFENLKNLLLRNTGLLWVTPYGSSPEAKSVKGMIRTLRIESEPKNLFSLDGIPLKSQGIAEIVKLAKTLRDPEVTRTQDQDFVWHDGFIHMPRMRLVKGTREQFAVEQGIYMRKTQNIWEGNRALEMTIDSAGSLDSIYFQRTDVLQQPVGEDEILIRVEAAGVSHRDLSLVLGSVPWAPPGFDGVGKVVNLGSQVTHLREGDLVFFLSLEGSAFSTYKKMPSWQAAKIPEGMSIPDAASLPLAYSIAVLALIQTARLRKGETVLIHTAAGAVGQACIVLAQHLGAQIFATAGTEAKRKFLHESFGIPETRIFSSRKPDFRDAILCQTNGKGMDVIVNTVGGELLAETWGVCAKFGRFVEVGKKDALDNNYLPMKPFGSNVTFTGIDIRDLYQYRPEDLREIFSEVANLLQRYVVVPIKPVTVLPISQFGTALRKLKSGENMGKIVVTLGSDESVVAETTLRPTQVLLKPDATYLITGGTRGIGLNLAYWMIEHGARNLVLLGRSGAAGPEIQKLLKQYEGTDIRIRAPPCDVGSRTDLAKALMSVQDLPRVRGVVHGALLLSDKLFENATHEDWEINTRPRITGAWNLHELLPNDLDFFIPLGSFLGDTGNAGQAIYASTASFYDAFTEYRNARGQYTVTIALPVVLDVGYVASNNLSNVLKQSLGATLTMADIRTIIKAIIIGKSSPFHHDGKAAAFKMYRNGQAAQDGPWKYFHPVYAKERLAAEKERAKGSGGGKGGDKYSTLWTAAEDPLVGLTGALITKISAMTMIDIDEVGPEIPLSSYGLDSLVSVELRNWIRRETGVELILSAITQAENLQSLAADVLAQREGAQEAQ